MRLQNKDSAGILASIDWNHEPLDDKSDPSMENSSARQSLPLERVSLGSRKLQSMRMVDRGSTSWRSRDAGPIHCHSTTDMRLSNVQLFPNVIRTTESRHEGRTQYVHLGYPARKYGCDLQFQSEGDSDVDPLDKLRQNRGSILRRPGSRR